MGVLPGDVGTVHAQDGIPSVQKKGQKDGDRQQDSHAGQKNSEQTPHGNCSSPLARRSWGQRAWYIKRWSGVSTPAASPSRTTAPTR